MRIVYLSATGAVDPTRASLPFHLAVNGSTEVGHDTAVVLAGDATDVLRAGTAEQVVGVGVPPLADLLAKVRDRGVEVHV